MLASSSNAITALSLLMPLVFVSACSSSSNNSTPIEALSRAAVMFIEQDGPGRVNSQPAISVETTALSSPKTTMQITQNTTASYSQTAGFCGTFAELDFNANDPFGLGTGAPLNAGEVITVLSNGNSYTELTALSEGSYEWNSSEFGQLPDNLVMNIPGSAFPAVNNFQIQPLENISIVDQQAFVTGDTLSWTASNTSNLPLWVVFNNGQLICITEDDGEFMIPDVGEPIVSILVQRRHIEVSAQSDAMLVVLRTNVNVWEPN